MNELRKASCEDASSLHNSFCSPFSLNELSTAISNLSSSTASGPDQIAYPLLKHLPEPAQLLLLSLFNRSWLSHTFGAHVQSLCSKFYPCHKALRSIATASWGPTKESLSLLYKAFVRPVLTYASPGWFPFLCNTATNHLEVLHRAACRVITGCLSSTPSSLLLLEAQLPPLKLTPEHQTLYSFERALRLPPDFSSLYALAIKNVPCRLKKKPSWRSSCSSATLPLPSPRESLITCPPFPPWSTIHFTVSPFIPDCTGSSTARLQIASNRLSSLPPLISKYGLTVLSPPFSVLVALESMLHAPNATHPIPYPFPLVQLPPASQPKSSPSSKVLLGVLAIS